MYPQRATPASHASAVLVDEAEGPDYPARPGLDPAQIAHLRDGLIAEANRQKVPAEEAIFAAFEFFMTGGEQGFQEALVRAAGRTGGRQTFFNEASRSIPELARSVIDRGVNARLVLGVAPDDPRMAFQNSYTRGLELLPSHRRKLSPPPPDQDANAWGPVLRQSLLRRHVDQLAPGEALVMYPPGGGLFMAGRNDDNSLLVVATKRREEAPVRGGGISRKMMPETITETCVREGRSAQDKVDMDITMPGRQPWVLVVAEPSGRR